jgi:hypothetical protein
MNEEDFDWLEPPGEYDEDDNPVFTPEQREAIRSYVQEHPNWREEERLLYGE